MEKLDTKITELLDKLYNLRGKDSTILCSIINEENEKTEAKNNASSTLEELNIKLREFNETDKLLTYEGQRLSDALATINYEDFQKVLDLIELEFNPEKLNNEVQKRLPRVLDSVKNDIENTEKEISMVESDYNKACVELEDLSVKHEEALNNQKDLNELFKQALRSKLNATREEITEVLSRFGLDEDEQREGAKLLMFPEDGLLLYESGEFERTEVAPVIEEETVTKPKFIFEPTTNVVLSEETEEPIVNVMEESSADTIGDFDITLPKEKEEVAEEEEIKLEEPKEDVVTTFEEPVIAEELVNNEDIIESSKPEEVIEEVSVEENPSEEETPVIEEVVEETPVVEETTPVEDSDISSSRSNYSFVAAVPNEPTITKDDVQNIVSSELEKHLDNTPEEDKKVIIEEPKEEVKKESKRDARKDTSKDVLVNKLTELQFDYLDFTNNDMLKMRENYDAATFEKNVALIEKLGISKDIFNDNIELIYDKDLEAKIDILLNVGKQPQDIYLNPNILVKYDLDQLNDAIKVLHDSGLDPKSVPLMAY